MTTKPSLAPATTTKPDRYHLCWLAINRRGPQDPQDQTVRVECLLSTDQLHRLGLDAGADAVSMDLDLSVDPVETWPLADTPADEAARRLCDEANVWQLTGIWQETYRRNDWTLDSFGVLIPPNQYHCLLAGVPGRGTIILSYTSLAVLNRLLDRVQPIWSDLLAALQQRRTVENTRQAIAQREQENLAAAVQAVRDLARMGPQLGAAVEQLQQLTRQLEQQQLAEPVGPPA
ncbi:MAG: hypothetical protein KKA73_27580 [Chloroflexi bacterium]|nr:hypothetical protein [Chloroflexota bacterium]